MLSNNKNKIPSNSDVVDAIKTGKINIVQDYIDHNGNVNANIKGKSLLHHAADNDQYDIADLLLKFNAAVSTLDSRGFTPLHYAASRNNPNMMALLLKHGAKINERAKDNCTALHYAVMKNAEEAVAFCIQQKANINALNYNNKTPVHSAILQGEIFEGNQYIRKANPTIMKSLLAAEDFDLHIKTNSNVLTKPVGLIEFAIINHNSIATEMLQDKKRELKRKEINLKEQMEKMVIAQSQMQQQMAELAQQMKKEKVPEPVKNTNPFQVFSPSVPRKN